MYIEGTCALTSLRFLGLFPSIFYQEPSLHMMAFVSTVHLPLVLACSASEELAQCGNSTEVTGVT